MRGGWFRATATAEDEEPRPIAQTPKVASPPFLPPEPTGEVLETGRMLSRALLDDGWEPCPRGPRWWDQRFTWPYAHAPEPLGLASPPANAVWRCEVTWYAGPGGAGFQAVAGAEGWQPLVIAESPQVTSPPALPPEPTAEIVEAAGALTEALLDAEWRPARPGAQWYDQRFTWPHPHPPEPLPSEHVSVSTGA
jgi:hypothetical protein